MKDSKTSSESTIKEFEIAVRNAEEKIDQITADSELVQSKVEKCLAIAKVIMGLGIAVSLKIGVVVSQKSEMGPLYNSVMGVLIGGTLCMTVLTAFVSYYERKQGEAPKALKDAELEKLETTYESIVRNFESLNGDTDALPSIEKIIKDLSSRE